MSKKQYEIFDYANKCYRMCTIKDIRDSCFEGIDQRTFKDLLSDDDYKALKIVGFESFLGLQNREVVEYIVEKVGKINKYIAQKTTIDSIRQQEPT